jgi:hypothetical protein
VEAVVDDEIADIDMPLEAADADDEPIDISGELTGEKVSELADPSYPGQQTA